MGLEKILSGIRNHAVFTTGMLTATHPIYCFLESAVANMPIDVSLNARYFSAAMAYAGLGKIYIGGRDLMRKMCKITDKSKEFVQLSTDMIYNAGFSTVLSPIIYLASGSSDAKEIVISTLGSAVIGMFTGGLTGYAADAFGDLTDIRKSERIPRYVRNKPGFIKKSIAAGTVALSIGVMATIYALTDNK